VDSQSLIVLYGAQISPSSSFILELSASSQIPSTAHGNGVHPPHLLLPVRERPHEAKVATRMTITEV
jgi:hypothetical protein